MDKKAELLWVEKAEWPKGWGIRAHKHEYYHLFYFLSGDSDFIVGKQHYTVHKGACFIVPPETTHELQKTTGELVSAYEVKFSVSDSACAQSLREYGPAYEGTPTLEKLIQFIVESGVSHVPDVADATEAALYTVITYFTRIFFGRSQTVKDSQLIDTAGFSELTISIIIYIESNYAKQVNLDIIAENTGYNKNYICSAFKKDTGVTIIDYLNFVRIRQAIVYFSYSEMDISLTSARVGFANVSHFNRTFKKFTGISPSAYKKLFPLDYDAAEDGRKHMAASLEKQLATIAEAFGIVRVADTELSDGEAE